MSEKLRIGLIGCGAIGTSLAKAIRSRYASRAQIYALYDKQTSKAETVSYILSKSKRLSVSTYKTVIQRCSFIVEAASAQSSYEIARESLLQRRSILIMSVGGILNKFTLLKAIAQKNGVKIYIPSGAIAGIDALKAAKCSSVKSVVLTTTKPPSAFNGVAYLAQRGIDSRKINRETILFEGTASQAVKYFPQNINVAGILSLAGVGARKTRVRIIASPKATCNMHEIEIVSSAGRITTRTENLVHPGNPKTSALAVYSAIATIDQVLEAVSIGT